MSPFPHARVGVHLNGILGRPRLQIGPFSLGELLIVGIVVTQLELIGDNFIRLRILHTVENLGSFGPLTCLDRRVYSLHVGTANEMKWS